MSKLKYSYDLKTEVEELISKIDVDFLTKDEIFETFLMEEIFSPIIRGNNG